MKHIIQIFIFTISLLFNLNCYALEVSSHIPPSPKEALIVIHGWRQNGKSMQWLTNSFKKDFPNMAFYYPTAPDKSPKGGYQWFEVPSLGETISQHKVYSQMMSTALPNLQYLHELIEHIHQQTDIAYEDIHISGFSQGGFMAILTALTYPQKIGKVISFSGVPIMFTKDFTSKHIKSSPEILIIQGTNDKVIPSNSHILTKQTLESISITPQEAIIPNMPHTINYKAQLKAKEFLK